MLVDDVKKAYAYSILADESADISGKEQLSIGVRFFDDQKMIVREEFLGFVELNAMDAKSISIAIDTFIRVDCGLDPNKCVGQGYDGCSTMAGKDGGVQKILRETYKKALYFHCASHRLNLVVNDLNAVVEIRNTISTVKDIINFFRESVVRRKYAPNIPAFCETRWSQKYKSISIFKNHFGTLVNGLEKLSTEGNAATRKAAFQLHSAATNSTFIICLFIISKYSALLEPVVNALQSKSLDIFQCAAHIRKILAVINDHRKNADNIIDDILNEARKVAEEFGVELCLPRITGRQQHRSNHPYSNFSDYWKRSLLIPYLDSLISSLDERFAEDNLPAFALLSLHPATMLKYSIEEVKLKTKQFSDFYQLDVSNEIELWYNLWADKKLEKQDIELCDVFKEAKIFYPSIKNALQIALAQPCTTCTIERSFSTLRRVKTWLRSTMSENRLNGKKHTPTFE